MSKKAAKPKKGKAARQSREAPKAAPEAQQDKHPGGRPSKYEEKYAEQAYKLCLLGATDDELADFFGVTEQTVNNWKTDYPQFFESLTRGKKIADAEVAHSMYHRALGYSHPEVHVCQHQGTVILTPLTKHYPPDTGAGTLWLKNRQPTKWRDKVETEHSTKPGDPIALMLAEIAGGARFKPPGAAT